MTMTKKELEAKLEEAMAMISQLTSALESQEGKPHSGNEELLPKLRDHSKGFSVHANSDRTKFQLVVNGNVISSKGSKNPSGAIVVETFDGGMFRIFSCHSDTNKEGKVEKGTAKAKALNWATGRKARKWTKKADGTWDLVGKRELTVLEV